MSCDGEMSSSLLYCLSELSWCKLNWVPGVIAGYLFAVVGCLKAEMVLRCGAINALCYFQGASRLRTLELGSVSGIKRHLHVALG